MLYSNKMIFASWGFVMQMTQVSDIVILFQTNEVAHFMLKITENTIK